MIGDPAFLAMDFDAHGRPDLANLLVDAWCEAADDHAAVALLPFHGVYRACVRALVAWLGPAAGQAGARRYLQTADRLAVAASRPATLTITHGMSGSGKSVAAHRVVASDGALRLRSDVERKRLAGLDPLADSKASGVDLYTLDWSKRTYARLESLADMILGCGKSVVVDAAFLKRGERRRFGAVATRHGVGFRIIDCRADVETLRRRIAARAASGGDPSEATVAVLARQLEAVEPIDADDRRAASIIDAGGPPP